MKVKADRDESRCVVSLCRPDKPESRLTFNSALTLRCLPRKTLLRDARKSESLLFTLSSERREELGQKRQGLVRNPLCGRLLVLA